MMNTTRHILLAASVMLLGLGACSTDDGSVAEPEDLPAVPVGEAAGDVDNTFDHMDESKDPFTILEEMQTAGPPAVSARLHACPKMRYETIGRVLASRGVNLGATDEAAAGRMWSVSDQALGAPNYGARARENLELTTASATKLFDIFVQAAPEIIANLPNQPECQIGGQGAQLFTASGGCDPDGLTCLMGVPATVDHLTQCNLIVNQASSPEQGRVMAVAAIMAAAHTCE